MAAIQCSRPEPGQPSSQSRVALVALPRTLEQSIAKVLVTGGAGLIGANLVDELLEPRATTARILDNLEPASHQGRPPGSRPEAEFTITGEFRPATFATLCSTRVGFERSAWRRRASFEVGLAQMARWFVKLGPVEAYFCETLKIAASSFRPTRASPVCSSDGCRGLSRQDRAQYVASRDSGPVPARERPASPSPASTC